MTITNILLGLILIALLVLIYLVYQLTFLLDIESKRESIIRFEDAWIRLFIVGFILSIIFAVIFVILWLLTPLTWTQWIDTWI